MAETPLRRLWEQLLGELMACPSALEEIEQHLVAQILTPLAQSQYRTGAVSHSELQPYAAEISRLSRLYTSHSVGFRLPEPTDTELSAEAYALYYTPINAAKILHLAPLVPPAPGPLRVLDFGSGPGTASLALLSALGVPLKITCVDHSAPMRRLASRLISSWRSGGLTSSLDVVAKLPRAGEQQFDLIVAANSLAELNESEAVQALEALVALLSPAGTLIVVEPGQLAHTRRLMRARDALSETLTPTFPCTRQGPCPMLRASESDWCHGTLSWQQPPLNRQLDELLGFNKHRIKYSAFAFQRGVALRAGYRVTMPARKGARGIEVSLCGQGFYGPVLIRKGGRSAGTRALERADLLDRVGLSEPPSSELAPTISSESLAP